MYIFSPTVDPAVFTALAILLPSVLTALSRISTPRSQNRGLVRKNVAPYRRLLNTAIFIHTLFTLYRLIFARPPNIFTFLNAPLSVPGPKLRSLMENMVRNDPSGRLILSSSLDDLITRLSSFDVRTIFIRFGQQSVESCTYCHSHSDYALYSLPRPLLEYIREAAFIGLITIRGSGPILEQRRTLGIALLVFAMIVEAWWLYTIPIALKNTKGDIIMWHDLCWVIRQLLFLTLPLILHTFKPLPPAYQLSNPLQQSTRPPVSPVLRFLSRLPFPLSLLFLPFSVFFRPPPPPPPPPINESVLRTARSTNLAMGRLTFLKLARGALLRDEELRERVGRYWEVQGKAGKAMRVDEDVQQIAMDRGLGRIYLLDEDEDEESVTEDGIDAEHQGKDGNVLVNMAREAVDGLKKIGLSPAS